MPARKPAALKIVEGRGNGTDKAGRLVNADPGWVRLPPSPPDWLEGHALECWGVTVEALQRLRLTKEGDYPTLVAYCVAYERMVNSAAVVKAEGITRMTAQGMGAHPAVGVLERASALVLRLAQDLGMTPASEQRVGTAGKDAGGDSDIFE